MKLQRTIVLLPLLFTMATVFASSIPGNLRCDFWTNPHGIDVSHPVLSWTIQTNAKTRAMHQTAYEVLVASTKELLSSNNGNLWKSGKVQSDRMGQILYNGKPLQSSQQCWWKVKVWDEKGIESEWSAATPWGARAARGNRCVRR